MGTGKILVFPCHFNYLIPITIGLNSHEPSFNTESYRISIKEHYMENHILRHSYATATLQATGSLSAVQASLGHSSSRMTERYAKVVALLDRQTAQKTSKFFGIFNK